MRALGIDIGASSAKLAYIDAHTTLTAHSERYNAPDREGLTRAVRQAVAGFRDLVAGGREASVRVGLCVPGRVHASGASIERSVNLPCLEGWRFKQLLSDTLGFTPQMYCVLSDIDAAAYDLCQHDQAETRHAVLAIGTGVGLTVFEDRQPLRIGRRGIGHLGQIDIGRLAAHDLIAPDGASNTLECFVGFRALRARYGDLDDEAISAVVRAMPMDDPFMRALVRGLRLIHAIYTPSAITVAGGIGLLLSDHADALRHDVSQGLTSLAYPNWSLQFGGSLYHAALGAARLASR